VKQVPLNKLLSFTKKVSDLADKPNATMSAAQVKAQFDAAPDELRLSFNALIDSLANVTAGDSGAKSIGVTGITGLTGADVQTLLESLKGSDDTNKAYLLSQIQTAVLGQIPDGSITDVKLSDGPTGIKQEFTTHLADYMAHGEVSSLYRTTKDANGVFTVLEWNRPSGSRFKRSALSGGTSPKYTTRTVTYYGSDGTTILATKTYTLTYTGEDLTSEVIV
jgi:hypothetical protein